MVTVLIYTNAPGRGFGYRPGEHSVSREVADKLVAAGCAELIDSPVEAASAPEPQVETAEIPIPTPTPPRPKRKRKKR